ncbi:ArsC/Spx/MgsR family protein [Enterococcus cecorum]|uniref:ArsC/Spx/MgsR family protein n=1 Tax=Enterococcus cecorum TaxID=44008 RepID=UPI00209C5E6E|nr:ArsC/Spx/MgsR family protein [Enterococcus cecorum]
MFHHEKSSNLLFEYSITGELDRCDTPRYWALTMIQSKWPIRRFFNTSGTKYKELHLKDKIDALSMEEACALLATDGMLIKRPILLKDNQFVTIGYKEDTYERLDV